MNLHRGHRQRPGNQTPQVPDKPSGRIFAIGDMTQCVARRGRRRRSARTGVENSTTRQDTSRARLRAGSAVRLDRNDHVRGGQRHG